MRINFSNNLYYSNLQNRQNVNYTPVRKIKYNAKCFGMPLRDTITFGQSSQVPPDALKSLQEQNNHFRSNSPGLYLYDHKKLEGMQNGIDIFEGLSFPEVAYFIESLKAIPLRRGCHNACIYCFADAQKHIDKIDFEDYEKLISGFKELNERFGYNLFGNRRHIPLDLFHDSDCSMITLQDKNGKMYDYADLAKMLFDVTDTKILFDTAGWNLNDAATQKRMEALVQKIANSNEYDFIKFYISVNPFHSIYNKSVELAQKGDYENAKKLRSIYTSRTANVIFTFSPLIGKTNSIDLNPQLEFIFRALYDETRLEGYRRCDLQALKREILDKLKQMYTDDLISENPKVVKDKKQMKEYLTFLEEFFLNRPIESVNLCNKRLEDKLEGIPSAERETARAYTFNSVIEGRNFKYGIVDINGKFYMTNYIVTYPTDLALNYKNKGKQTAPMAPNLRDIVITKRAIEDGIV